MKLCNKNKLANNSLPSSFNACQLCEHSSIAVLIPCYNEACTIAGVIASFRKYLPGASIYVYDNNSEDCTADVAKKAGAIVEVVKDRGKGNVVRKMFSNINADIYVMMDGDSTYTVENALEMISRLINDKVDMVVGVRKEKSKKAYRTCHKFGNKMFNFIFMVLFNSTFKDVFSGYRVFTKRFVKTLPIAANGFDIETEISVHTLTLGIPFAEVNSAYLERPKNSFSKLNTLKDGFKILVSIIRLLTKVRPLFFFGTIFLILFFISVSTSTDALMWLSFLSLTCGIILNGISQIRIEVKKLHYLHFY